MNGEAGVPSRTPILRVFFGFSGLLFLAVGLWFAAYHRLLRHGRCVFTAGRELLECRLELFGRPFGKTLRVELGRVTDLRVVHGEYGWHVAFDSDGRTHRLGLSLTEEEAREVCGTLKPLAARETYPDLRFRLPERVCGGHSETVE